MKVPNKNAMKALGQEVYTDGTLAFKFYDSYHERHPNIEVEALRRVQNLNGVQRFVDYDEKRKILSDQNGVFYRKRRNDPGQYEFCSPRLLPGHVSFKGIYFGGKTGWIKGLWRGMEDHLRTFIVPARASSKKLV